MTFLHWIVFGCGVLGMFAGFDMIRRSFERLSSAREILEEARAEHRAATQLYVDAIEFCDRQKEQNLEMIRRAATPHAGKDGGE